MEATEHQDYDYIVVGSGPGGGPLAANLARKGQKVLLLEAGDDQGANPTQVVPTFFAAASEDPTMAWSFFIKQYEDNAQDLRNTKMTWTTPSGEYYVGLDPPPGSKQLGILYPRAATIGGCSTHNALLAVRPHDSDWAHIAKITGDRSWGPENMLKYFKRLERCEYLPKGTKGHGFNGWLATNHPSGNSTGDGCANIIESALHIMQKTTGEKVFYPDINADDANRDKVQGLFQNTLHMDSDGRRSSVQTYLSDTVKAKNHDGSKKYPLTISTHSLATRVLFDQEHGKGHDHGHKRPKAIGVEYLYGQSLYKADPRATASSSDGTLKKAFAKKEVIVAGGAFNTPQILKLSGIGPRSELSRFDIPVVVDLPGVGTNLQDNPESGAIGHAPQDFTVFANCTFGQEGDVCLAQWEKGQGPYKSNGLACTLIQTSSVAENGENDVVSYGGPLRFRGFYPGYSQDLAVADYFTFGLLKVSPRNRGHDAGTVTLRSADPRDVPDINLKLFNTKEGDKDLQAMAEAVQLCRQIYEGVSGPVGPLTSFEPAPSATTIEQIKQHIKDEVFSHHATSTCAIGSDKDPYACLDSKFRVRGVENLRVVDASAFPNVPGSFPTIPTMMISEKATDVILEDA